jgi:3-deoxy-manno-octulosonate cytidylyltransferase (CMP-KDO synthetase)
MRTLAVIPARLAATRLPRKPLRLVGGAPLIVRVWQRVHAMHIADVLLVATDSDEIAAVISERGGKVAMTRGDHASGTDRVAEVVECPPYDRFDVIINVQGDEPFVSAESVRGAADLVRQGHFELATAAAPADPEILERPDVVKVVTANDGRALYFSRAAVPHLRDEADRAIRAALVRQHVGVYAYTREALLSWVSLPPQGLERAERLEQLRPLAAGMVMGVYVTAAAAARGVDTEEDLIQANTMWTDFYAGRT